MDMGGLDKSPGMRRRSAEWVPVSRIGGSPIDAGQRDMPAPIGRSKFDLQRNRTVLDVPVAATAQKQARRARQIDGKGSQEAHMIVQWIGVRPGDRAREGFGGAHPRWKIGCHRGTIVRGVLSA